jgi:hypothetical protein|tara:strand:- start:119 stop:532 length:414 start_codon:yes stop_codon:yes gene_type:complete
MVREFNDYEFKLYGSVQSFFYRCWKGFGRGQVLDGGRRKLINQDLTNKWARDLFPTGSSPKSGFLVESFNVVYLNDNPNAIELWVNTGRVLGTYAFVVDISQNLEDYAFYNIKWVFNTEIDTKESSNYSYRPVPKIF